MLQGIATIFDDMEKMMKRLKKKTFEENTDVFIKKHGHFFMEMTEYVESSEKKEVAAEEVAQCFVQAVKDRFSNKNGKIGSNVQVDLNFFMIYYVFPTLLGLNHEDSDLIAEKICTAWGENFKGAKIQYTDYDTLYAGFREKIFGIF